MAKTLLRSGNLDDFQAVGGGGQAVFESALQIREALRLRKQQSIVDCLAIPQVNDEGDRVDWYAPVEGSVSSWKAA
ncbi:ssrAB-activated protein, partial [Escherichia coli]|nr:ssrAB-activated protein [Escherichia coli]